jgi:hypothetical protein
MDYYKKHDMYMENYTPYELARQINKQGRSLYIKCASTELLSQLISVLRNENEMREIMKLTDYQVINKIKYIEDPNSKCLYITFDGEKTPSGGIGVI